MEQVERVLLLHSLLTSLVSPSTTLSASPSSSLSTNRLDIKEEGVTSGASGEGVVALRAFRHIGTVCLDHVVGVHVVGHVVGHVVNHVVGHVGVHVVGHVGVCPSTQLDGVDNGCAGAVMLPIHRHLFSKNIGDLIIAMKNGQCDDNDDDIT